MIFYAIGIGAGYVGAVVLLLGPFGHSSAAEEAPARSRIRRWRSKPRSSIGIRGLFAHVTMLQFLPLFYLLFLTVFAVRGLFGSYGLAVGVVALAAEIPLALLFTLFLFRPVGRHASK
jgi:hypothetical protein